MGEAKRCLAKAQHNRSQFFRQHLWGMAAPPLDGEVDLYREIMSLPDLLVRHASNTLLTSIGMLPNRCHDNVMAWLRDVEPTAKAVTGWTCGTGLPILHSVIDRGNGRLVCITPLDMEWITFRPDPLLTFEHGPERKGIYRGDTVAPRMVRPDPADAIAAAQECLALLDAGVDILGLPKRLLQRTGCLVKPDIDLGG